jgi:RNA polymerase sigma factor (sigma-70 family)
MEPTTFTSLKDAKQFVRARAVERALVPLLGVLRPAEIAEVRDFLDDLTTTHPLVRTLATRAAKQVFAPFAAPLRAAARLDDHDECEEADDNLAREIPDVPIARHDRELPLPEGAVDLGRPEYYQASRRVIEALATQVTSKWTHPYEELVREGWLVAVEIAPDWDRSRARYTTYLWRHVRTRLIDVAKKASNAREMPASAIYVDDFGKGEEIPEDAVDRFDEAVSLAAMSYALGFENGPLANPEEQLERIRERDQVRAAIASLDDRSRRIIELVYFEGHDLREAGAALGVSYATVRRDHGEALGALQAHLSGSSKVVPLAARGAKKPAPVSVARRAASGVAPRKKR